MEFAQNNSHHEIYDLYNPPDLLHQNLLWIEQKRFGGIGYEYLLVNVYITMKNDNAISGKFTISMAIFNSKL